MDIIQEIKRWLNKNSQPPWPTGYNPDKASDAAKFALKLLSPEELIAISKFNRFRVYRNQILIQVKEKYRLPAHVLPELSGLSYSTTEAVCGAKRKNG